MGGEQHGGTDRNCQPAHISNGSIARQSTLRRWIQLATQRFTEITETISANRSFRDNIILWNGHTGVFC